MNQRRDRGVHSECARGRITIGDAGFAGRAGGVTAYGKEPGLGAEQAAVTNEAGIRPGLPVAGKRQHDQIGSDFAECFVAKAHALDYSRSEIFRDDIAVRSQRARDFDRLRLFQIQKDAAFALVPLVEAACSIEAGIAVGERWYDAVDVGPLGTFDANHFSAEMSKLQGAEWSLPDPSEIEHAYAAQWSGFCVCAVGVPRFFDEAAFAPEKLIPIAIVFAVT